MDDPYSISELNSLIKSTIKENIRGIITIRGELYNYKKNGERVFTSVRDNNSLINLICWRCDNELQNGEIVIAKGYLEFYSGKGTVSFIANSIESEGKGKLFEVLEKRRKHYEALRYFDDERKRKLPERINSVGIVTASNGAAIQDILYVLRMNKFAGKINIKNSPVQGAECPKGICEGIRFFNSFTDEGGKKVDVILIARGGGSIDDLIGFSDQEVIEELFKSNILTISAIGHETDTMLSDLVADIRAPTPSIAAELISSTNRCAENKISLLQVLFNKHRDAISSRIKNLKISFENQSRLYIRNKREFYARKLYQLEKKLEEFTSERFEKVQFEYNTVKNKFESYKNTKYNAVIISNGEQIENIDSLKSGKYVIIIGDKRVEVKIKVI